MKIDDLLIERLRACDLVTLAERYTTVVRSRNGAKARCMFHDDHTPSMTIFRRDGVWLWRCHVCDIGGDAIRFVERAHACSFEDACAALATHLGIALIGADPKRAREMAHDIEARRTLLAIDEGIARLANTAAIEAHRAERYAQKWGRLYQRAVGAFGFEHPLTNLAADEYAKALDESALLDARYTELHDLTAPDVSRADKVVVGLKL